MKKILNAIAAITLIIAMPAICGCSKKEGYRIGVSQCSSDDWRNKMNEEIMREALILDESLDVEIRSGEDSNENQIADLQYFVDNGFDAIIVAPNEAEALTPIIKDIHSKGIPVIVFDRSVIGNDYTAYQGADNASIGKEAALLAYSYCGKDAKVIEICGNMESTPAEERQRGFHNAADSLGMPIVASASGLWNYENASVVADSLLAAHPEANIIYAHNDRMAMGASDVAKRLGMRDKVKIIGIDAAPGLGIKAVADGTIDATFVYPTEGQSLIATALAILKGEPYNANNIIASPQAVVSTNAELLLRQDEALRRETGRIASLKSRIDDYWQKHSLQTALLYGVVAILILIGGLAFVLMRAYWSNKRHRREMEERNRTLQQQHDELDELYHKLEEATGSKLTFFTNVSHDLRTPLTLIADPVHQMAEATNITPQQRTLMQLADKNVKRLNRLINQILDIRKFDNGHLALNLRNADLSLALKEWAMPFADAAARRHIKFYLDVAPGADYVTAIDVEKIERVLFNLLSNAFKFTPANGTITISLQRQDDTITLKVSDTGPGIKSEDMKQVFDRFFHSGTEVNPNGSGIGLALSKTFVQMHEGDIAVESELGVGTTFIVTLPVKSVDIDAADTSLAAAVAAADVAELAEVEEEDVEIKEDAPTLLVIDDNEDISLLIKSILSDKYTVLRAANGAQGIRMASKYIPDLIICDVMMPGMDGYETCRRLKGEEVTSHIPVLLLTACSQQEQRTEGYNCGADGYMSKPFDSDMLKARCQSLIDNRRRIYATITDAKQPQKPQAATSPKGDIDDEFYARFIEAVEKNLSKSEITVEDLAAMLGLSRVQMYRKIKALTNYSPAELLRNTRLEHAARLLKTTQRTISEIAYEVGFTAPGYFTKCYKEYFNEAPSDTQARTSKISG